MSGVDLVVTKCGLRAFGRVLPCSVGRGGVVAAADKQEGDGATPRGVHRIVAGLYRPDRLLRPAAWMAPVRLWHGWSDDVSDPAYNRLVRRPHGPSHEAMWRADPMYDLVLITDWNWPEPVPGKGSAIFVHQWRRRGAPTAGCVGLSRSDLVWLISRIGPGARLRVV